MKNSKIVVLASLFVALIFSGCKEEEDVSNDLTQVTIETNVQSGSWRITNFIDDGMDETSDFAGYNFTFNNNGVLTATNGSNTYNGTWIITSDDGDDLSDLELDIVFNLTNDFEDLTDDWDFISQSSTKLELIDISGGGEQDDLLTFERN